MLTNSLAAPEQAALEVSPGLEPGLAGREKLSEGQLERALSRAGGYRFLARLFGQELDEALLAFLCDNSQFLPEIKLPSTQQRTRWLQTLRVEYARLFILNVYPFASIYTGQEVLLNTAQTEQVRNFYARYGFDYSSVGSRAGGKLLPDHLAVELDFMGSLIETEGRYWQAGNSALALSVALAEQTFLVEQLLSWLPVFGLAVDRASRHDFYPALVKQCLDFICQDFQFLLEQQAEAGPKTGAAPTEEPAQILPDFGVASAKEMKLPASLKEFVRYLITPAKSGLYLSKIELFRLSHSLQLPIGVTERFQMLESLLRNAFDYQMVEPLVAALRGWVQDYRLEVARLQQAYPRAAFIWQAWEQQLNRSLAVIGELNQLLNSAEIAQDV